MRATANRGVNSSMLSAVAFALMFIEIPIPALIPAFVKLDISDLPELLAAFSLGPVYGVVVALMKNLLIILIKGSSSANVGELCNFVLGAVFSLVAGILYRRKKSRKSALIGSIIGAALMALISVPLNYFVVYPAYVACYGMSMAVTQALSSGTSSAIRRNCVRSSYLRG